MCKRKPEDIEDGGGGSSSDPHQHEEKEGLHDVLVNLQRQEIYQVMHEGVMKYECDLCDFRCLKGENMKNHRLTHFTDVSEEVKKKMERKVRKKVRVKTIGTSGGKEKKTFPCDHPGCDYSSYTKGGLRLHKQKHEENPVSYPCTHEGCDFSTIYPSGLKRHMDTHSGTKEFECDLCDFKCAQKSNLATHRATHFEERAFSCDWEGCDYTAKTHGAMITHRNTHTRENVFPCHHPGCDHEALTTSGLIRHKLTHSDERNEVCPHEGCDFTCKSKQYMKVHSRVHQGIKVHICPHPGCSFKTAHFTSLVFHKRGHSKDKRYVCREYGCDYKAVSPQSLKLHMMTHTGDYPFECTFPGCGHKCGQKNDFERHLEVHTLDGQTRRLKQENRVYNKLLEWGYTVDREMVINASRDDCVVDTDRHFSRLDFHIINCTSAILIVECDEMQHEWYSMRCEMGRMMDVQTALVSKGYTLPVYWLRYSPNGKYFVGDNKIGIQKSDREEELKRQIEKICDPSFVPEKNTTIHYMFYDLSSDEEGPKILDHPEFPESMAELVSW